MPTDSKMKLNPRHLWLITLSLSTALCAFGAVVDGEETTEASSVLTPSQRATGAMLVVPDDEILQGLSASLELGWLPNDDLSVTALNEYADLLPQIQQIAGPPVSRETIQVTVEDIIQMTLDNSVALEQASFQPRIRAESIQVARGNVFDTDLSASATVSGSEPSYGNGSTSLSVRTGLSQRLVTGGMLDLNLSLSSTHNSSRTSGSSVNSGTSATVTARQPLLRGFGPTVTRQSIRSATLESQAALWDYSSTVMDTVADSMSTHWDLFFAQRQALVQLLSLEQARVVLRNNRIRRSVGDMTRAEELQAASTVAQREGSYLSGLRSIQDTEDALWILIDRSGALNRWNSALIPVDQPTLEEMPLSEEQLIALAFQMRPDLQAALIRLENSELSRRVARNSVLPQLDAFATFGFTGSDGNIGHAFDDWGTLDHETWSTGLEFSFPLQNRAARHSLRQAELSLEQSQVALEALRLRILLEVRNTLRRLQNSLDLLAAREAEVEARQIELLDEQSRYDVGLSTTELLLRFQDDLASARINRISSQVDYVQGIIELDRVIGRLLERHSIVLDPVGAEM